MGEALATESLEQQLELGTDIMRRIPERGEFPLPLGDTLHVPTGHTVVIVHGGRVTDVLGSGPQRLIPRVLSELDTTAELRDLETGESVQVTLIVLNSRTIDKRWGTRHPLMVRDAECGPLRLRGYGGYGFRLGDPGRFVEAIVGQQGISESEQVENFLRDVIVARLNVEAGELTDDVSELSASTVELVRRARQQLMNDFDRYGLELIDVKLHALILPDRAHAVWQRHTGTPDEPAGQGVEDTGERGPALTRVELASSAGVARLLPKMHIQTLPSDDGASAATSAENADVAGDEPTSGHCSGCEREAPAEAKFCPWCGQSLGGEA